MNIMGQAIGPLSQRIVEPLTTKKGHRLTDRLTIPDRGFQIPKRSHAAAIQHSQFKIQDR